MQTTLLVSTLLMTVVLFAISATAEITPGMAKVTFVVHCCDVGVSALSGKSGVVSVERG